MFVETLVGSLLEIGDATFTDIVQSTPTTLVCKWFIAHLRTRCLLRAVNSVTFAEDASFISESEAQTTTRPVGDPMVFGDDSVCTGTRGGEVTCVMVESESLGDGQTSAVTLTYSATRVPIFTIKSGGEHVMLSMAMIFCSTSFVCLVLRCL